MNSIEIEIGGKKRRLKFNHLSLEIFFKHFNSEAHTSSTIYATFFAGLLGNCYVKEQEPDFTFEDVSDWVDELYNNHKVDEITKVCDAWAETNTLKEWIKSVDENVKPSNTIIKN